MLGPFGGMPRREGPELALGLKFVSLRLARVPTVYSNSRQMLDRPADEGLGNCWLGGRIIHFMGIRNARGLISCLLLLTVGCETPIVEYLWVLTDCELMK